jgi:N-acetylglucosaminyldiphosphoundecaprenol N-acetyl-beta-D-mannosaminyltransferase
MAPTDRTRVEVLGAPIDVLGWDRAVGLLTGWGAGRESRVVCICNVHSVVTASRSPEFRELIAGADLATPDGMPVAWRLRRAGHLSQERINGPDLMWRYLVQAEQLGQVVFFYGSTEATLSRLRSRLAASFPALRIGGMVSPPFRSLTPEEDEAYVRQINEAGSAVVFVGLGCPRQEQWMAEHRGPVRAVMVGVGAAFDYHAGTLRRAPLWMQRNGLEWLYRLAREPRRLWKRYLVTNALFLFHTAREFFSDLPRER